MVWYRKVDSDLYSSRTKNFLQIISGSRIGWKGSVIEMSEIQFKMLASAGYLFYVYYKLWPKMRDIYDPKLFYGYYKLWPKMRDIYDPKCGKMWDWEKMKRCLNVG